MAQRIGDMEIGTQFHFQGTIYVRIPEMVLKCGTHGFIVNMITVKESLVGECAISTNVAEFLHPDISVELIAEVGPDVQVQDEKE